MNILDPVEFHLISSSSRDTEMNQRLKISEKLIADLIKHTDAWPFLEPVKKREVSFQNSSSFLPRPLREVLNSGILSVRLFTAWQPNDASLKAKFFTINWSCYIDGWMNDFDFYVISMVYHKDSSDFFDKS